MLGKYQHKEKTLQHFSGICKIVRMVWSQGSFFCFQRSTTTWWTSFAASAEEIYGSTWTSSRSPDAAHSDLEAPLGDNRQLFPVGCLWSRSNRKTDRRSAPQAIIILFVSRPTFLFYSNHHRLTRLGKGSFYCHVRFVSAKTQLCIKYPESLFQFGLSCRRPECLL